MKTKKLKIEQVDANAYSAEYSASKKLDIGNGIDISFNIRSYGTDKQMVLEKVYLGLIELAIEIENGIEDFKL
jgi:hypothetical protein